MSELRTGGCQCGALRYEVKGDPIAIAVCHCSDCQLQSGSAFGMSMIVPKDAFEIVKGEPKRFTKTAESGTKIDCVFCDRCGSRICHIPIGSRGTVNVKPGTLDDRSWLAPTVHAWTRSKQPWIVVPEDALCFETQPVPKSS